MANTDIRLKLSFQHHAKTKKLRFKLGEIAELKFIYLMCYAAENRPDGVLHGMDKIDIAMAANWAGDPDEFVDVLTAIRYLDLDGETYRIHDWTENNPWASKAEERSEHARKAANAKHGKKDSATTKKQVLTSKSHAPSDASDAIEISDTTGTDNLSGANGTTESE